MASFNNFFPKESQGAPDSGDMLYVGQIVHETIGGELKLYAFVGTPRNAVDNDIVSNPSDWQELAGETVVNVPAGYQTVTTLNGGVNAATDPFNIVVDDASNIDVGDELRFLRSSTPAAFVIGTVTSISGTTVTVDRTSTTIGLIPDGADVEKLFEAHQVPVNSIELNSAIQFDVTTGDLTIDPNPVYISGTFSNSFEVVSIATDLNSGTFNLRVGDPTGFNNGELIRFNLQSGETVYAEVTDSTSSTTTIGINVLNNTFGVVASGTQVDVARSGNPAFGSAVALLDESNGLLTYDEDTQTVTVNEVDIPDGVTAAVAGETYDTGAIVTFNDNYYGATANTTLSDPIVETDFDTNWVLLSGGDAAVADSVDDLNSTENLTFWRGTQAEYDAIATPDENTLYYITDNVAVLGTFLGLEDTPQTYGTPGQVAVVNDDANGLVFANQSGGGGINPEITSVTFINDYTGDPGGTVTAAGTNHAPLNEVSYIEIAGSTFTSLAGVDPTVTLRIGGTDVDLSEFPVSAQSIRATIPAQGLMASDDPTTATLIVTNALGGVSEPFEITFSAGPSLTSSGEFVAPEGGMVSVTLTAVTNDMSTATFTAISTLPSWLTLTDNGDNTATVSGTVPAGTMPGTNPYIIRATEGDGTQTDITLNIGAGSGIFGQSLGSSVLIENITGSANYLSRTTTARIEDRTYSVWFKKTQNGVRNPIITTSVNTTNGSGVNYDGLDFNTSDQPFAFFQSNRNETANTDIVLRDTSAWYHVVLSMEFTNVPRMWINGVEVPSSDLLSGVSGGVTALNSGNLQRIGRLGALAHSSKAYIAQAIMVDGQHLTADSFGEFSDEGYWQPIQYPVGATGDQGYILNFEDSSNLGLDSSTNGNNFTVNGTVTQVNDTVTDNHATFTGRVVHGTSDFTAFSNGNRTAITSATFAQNEFEYTIRVPKEGKYYFEIFTNVIVSNNHELVRALPFGILPESGARRTTNGYWNLTETGAVNGLTATGASVAAPTPGQDIGVALDMDNGTVQFYIDGTISGGLYNIDNFTDVPDGGYTLSGELRGTAILNTGQEDFDLTTLPTGFGPLSTATLPDPTVVPSENFVNGTYTGNSGTNTVTSSLAFQPDLVMIKNTSSIGYGFFDSIRGGAEYLTPSSSAGQTDFGSAGLTFDSNGFTIGGESSTLNNSSFNYVYHAWRAGGAAVENTDGSVTSMVSANEEAGFSVISASNYRLLSASDTVGHGLSQAPDFLITKRVDASEGWYTYHSAAGDRNYAELQLANAFSTGSGFQVNATTFNATSLTSTRDEYIAYAWHSVPGYSDFGQYTGNSNVNGPFINCGFKPALVIIKGLSGVSGGGNWYIYSNETPRNGNNPVEDWLRLNSTVGFNGGSSHTSTNSDYSLDFYANGFKCIDSHADVNQDGARFIYCAFAETPFKYSLGR